MSKLKHGTPNPSQFMTILTAIGKAVATAITIFPTKELMQQLNSKGDKLTEYIRLAFTALLNDQELRVQDPPKLRFSMQFGNYKTPLALRRALIRSNLQVHEWMMNMVKSKFFSVFNKPTKMNFVAVTGEELGFKTHFGIEELFKRAAEEGFALCPPELGPQIYLHPQYNFLNENHLIAMEPIEIETYKRERGFGGQREKCIFEFRGNSVRVFNRVDCTGFPIMTSFIFQSAS